MATLQSALYISSNSIHSEPPPFVFRIDFPKPADILNFPFRNDKKNDKRQPLQKKDLICPDLRQIRPSNLFFEVEGMKCIARLFAHY